MGLGSRSRSVDGFGVIAKEALQGSFGVFSVVEVIPKASTEPFLAAESNTTSRWLEWGLGYVTVVIALPIAPVRSELFLVLLLDQVNERPRGFSGRSGATAPRTSKIP